MNESSQDGAAMRTTYKGNPSGTDDGAAYRMSGLNEVMSIRQTGMELPLTSPLYEQNTCCYRDRQTIADGDGRKTVLSKVRRWF